MGVRALVERAHGGYFVPRLKTYTSPFMVAFIARFALNALINNLLRFFRVAFSPTLRQPISFRSLALCFNMPGAPFLTRLSVQLLLSVCAVQYSDAGPRSACVQILIPPASDILNATRGELRGVADDCHRRGQAHGCKHVSGIPVVVHRMTVIAPSFCSGTY